MHRPAVDAHEVHYTSHQPRELADRAWRIDERSCAHSGNTRDMRCPRRRCSNSSFYYPLFIFALNIHVIKYNIILSPLYYFAAQNHIDILAHFRERIKCQIFLLLILYWYEEVVFWDVASFIFSIWNVFAISAYTHTFRLVYFIH